MFFCVSLNCPQTVDQRTTREPAKPSWDNRRNIATPKTLQITWKWNFMNFTRKNGTKHIHCNHIRNVGNRFDYANYCLFSFILRRKLLVHEDWIRIIVMRCSHSTDRFPYRLMFVFTTWRSCDFFWNMNLCGLECDTSKKLSTAVSSL